MLNLKKTPWIDNPMLFFSLRDDDYATFVEKLFNNIYLLNTPNVYGETLAHYCCFLGYIDKYYALIHMGAEIKKTNKKDTLLHYASLGGKDSFLVSELAKEGMSPLEKNEDGVTPIHLVSDGTTASYFHLWLQINNISLTSITDDFNNNIAHIAVQNGHHSIAQYWINHEPILETSVNYENKKPLQVSFKPHSVCSYQ